MRTHKGSCHCGRIRFEVDADLDHVRSCDCTVCRRRGALIHRVEKDKLRLLVPWESMTLYQWRSRTARDYFCPKCGILPFRRPADPTPQELLDGVQPFDGWGVNVRCWTVSICTVSLSERSSGAESRAVDAVVGEGWSDRRGAENTTTDRIMPSGSYP